MVAYHVVDDNTAFLVWETDDGDEPNNVFLARVDSAGATVWTREIPGALPSGDVIRVGRSAVGVRYRRNARGPATELRHSMIAFDHDGARLWDAVLAPGPLTPDGPTAPSASDEQVGGAVVADRFIEWAPTGSTWLMIGIDPSTGRTLFRNAIDEAPSALYSTSAHLVWEDRDREDTRVAHALDQGTAPVVHLHSVDVMSGTMQHATTAGRGCVLDGNYMTAVDNGSTQSLVAFSGGDLGSRTELAPQFDPLGDGRPFRLQSCGRYRGQLVFAIDTVVERTPELIVVVADRTAKSIRAARLTFDRVRGLRGLLPGRFAQQAPLSGELSRFVPIVVPTTGTGSEDALVMLDLDAAAVSWTAPLGTAVFTYLYRVGNRWYLTNVENKHLSLSLLDGEPGELIGAFEASPETGDAWYEQSLLPVHVGPRSVWLMSHERTSITALPMIALDTITLQPNKAQTRVRIKDMTTEVRGRIARMRQ